jgi:hypothetical protein
MSLTSCASNFNGSAFPYNPSASASVYRYNLSQGRSYNPIKSATNFLDVSGNGITGTANNVSNEYYPWKYGGMVRLNNPVGFGSPQFGYGKTLILNVGTSSEWTFIVAWEYVATNGYYNSDIIAGAYSYSTHDWWIGQAAGAGSSYSFYRNGTGYSLGGAPVIGTRYLAVVGNNFTTNAGYFYLFDSDGNSNSNTNIGGLGSNTAGLIGLGQYGQFPDVYLPNIFIGDAIYSDTYLSTTDALKIKDSIKYRYGITV